MFWSSSSPCPGPPCPRSGGHLRAHHAVLRTLRSDVREAGILEEAPGAVVEDRYPLALGVVRVPLHHPATGLRDQVERTAKGDRRESLPSVLLVHEDARDPVVGQGVAFGVVLL